MPTSSVIPELPYADVVAAAEWLCEAFGFRERLRIGGHRVQLTYGDGAVVVVNGSGRSSTMVRVEDVDAHCRVAVAAGAEIVAQPETFPYGERQYVAVDPGGHSWTFSQTVDDSDPAGWGGVLRS